MTDVLVLCMRYTKEMRGMLGARELVALRPGAYVINVAWRSRQRGSPVRTSPLGSPSRCWAGCVLARALAHERSHPDASECNRHAVCGRRHGIFVRDNRRGGCGKHRTRETRTVALTPGCTAHCGLGHSRFVPSPEGDSGFLAFVSRHFRAGLWIVPPLKGA